MTEILKSMNYLNPLLVWEYHEKNQDAYNLRIQSLCKLPKQRTLSSNHYLSEVVSCGTLLMIVSKINQR